MSCEYKNAEGYCTIGDVHKKCQPSTEDWCDESVGMCEIDEMCALSSCFGNTFSFITEEQIEELKNGKVIYIDDSEYCHFIRFKKEN